MEADSLVMQGPPHVWIKLMIPRDAKVQKRYCPTCQLCDSRPNVPHPNENHGWQVYTPCILPVPETIDEESFRLKLIEHGVTHRYAIQETAMGSVIGFKMEDETLYPKLKIMPKQTVEHAFSRLLRWVKARYYVISRYKDPSFDEEVLQPPIGKAV